MYMCNYNIACDREVQMKPRLGGGGAANQKVCQLAVQNDFHSRLSHSSINFTTA